MERNVGQTDRYVRIVVGIVLALVGIAGFVGTGWEATGTVGLAAAAVLVIVGAVLLITAATQQCPIYAGLSMSTFKGRSS
ncbi:MAG TPA: DUF2892 domain-containing protein [Natrialbaceae archaeon]|nr:DUF2892 domain-containing protein [Natrialbaceae archaeon]